MTNSRLPNRQDDDSGDRIFQIIMGEHLGLIAFVALCILGVFFVYVYFGRGETNPLAAIPSPQQAAAIFVDGSQTGDNALVPSIIQRHQNSTGPAFVGVIAGHKDSDAGAVCDDGLTEAQININIADKVVRNLISRGVNAEILSEFDGKLNPNYDASVVVSIHADSCTGPAVNLTGYKTAISNAPSAPLLQQCINTEYATQTGLAYNANTITNDMINYHAFGSLGPNMPAIIVEAGFMSMDRDLLTNRADVPANAIADGVVCFLERSQ